MAPSTPNATAVYGNLNAPVALRIGTGGAGESGLLQALAEAFLASQGQDAAIEWYTTHTSDSLNYLQQGVVDVAITYHGVAELTALEKGIADRVEYAWRDHWMLVGPKSNPASLPSDGQSSIYALLTRLVVAMEGSQESGGQIKFLSRYDKSASNIKDSALFAAIGVTPWVAPAAPWYHTAHAFPFQALRSAAELGEYTLTDRGTWCAIEQEVREGMEVFKEGTGDEHDPLLNPAHLLVGTEAENKKTAEAFAQWMVQREGGQKVIREFARHGLVLYQEAPGDVDALGVARGLMYPGSG